MTADPAAQAVPASPASTVTTLPVRSAGAADEHLRERLSEFRALLVISLLMTESVSEDQILDLAASSAPGLGPWRIDGYSFGDGQWRPGLDPLGPASSPPPGLTAQLAACGSGGGKVELPGRAWAWAYPLRGAGGPLGHLVASCAREPTADERFGIQVIAQQTGVAVSNARLHARERATAAELATANATLADTVASLRRTMDIHDRLTRVAVSGEGQPGIAKALHELTGMSVVIEDRYGNLSAWAGPGQPEPYPGAHAHPVPGARRQLRRDRRRALCAQEHAEVPAAADPRAHRPGPERSRRPLQPAARHPGLGHPAGAVPRALSPDLPGRSIYWGDGRAVLRPAVTCPARPPPGEPEQHDRRTPPFG